MRVRIRIAEEKDYPSIYKINDLAFAGQQESNLIASLKSGSTFIDDLSFVAENEEEIIGHLLFSKILLHSGSKDYETLALAPMCVKPDYQKMGIGSLLVEEGLRQVIEKDYDSIFVVGHKDYYPQFGFIRASNFEILSPWELPKDIFMAIELKEDALKFRPGKLIYPTPFLEM